jgi:hypothetical protein
MFFVGELAGSILGWEAGYPDRDFSCSSLHFPEKYQKENTTYPFCTLPNSAFIIIIIILLGSSYV